MFYKNEIKQILVEELTKPDVVNIIKKDKDVEKRVKEIVTDVITKLFKILWQHKNFYDSNLVK